MTQTTDFVAELIYAANTIHEVTPFERKRLMERGMVTIRALSELSELNGKVVSIRSRVVQEVASMIPLADTKETPDVVLAAGMLEIAEEIRRLRVLAHEGRGG